MFKTLFEKFCNRFRSKPKKKSPVKSYERGADIQLSENFHLKEFDCKCKYDDCKKTLVNMNHVNKLQEKRDKWKRRIKITSGYRCKKYNKDVGGVKKSQHVLGNATDIQVRSFKDSSVQRKCEDFNGLGRYNTFTHIDSRPGKRARWDRTKK